VQLDGAIHRAQCRPYYVAIADTTQEQLASGSALLRLVMVSMFSRLSLLQAGSAPDVWLQLLEHCVADSDCQPTALCSLALQLAGQRSRTAQLEQQVSKQQQQIASLLQHAFVQQQDAAHQRAQLAGMQEQLQLLLPRQELLDKP
jgi:hypothetical protein